MENTHKELSDKEIALELTKLLIPSANTSNDKFIANAKNIADAYNTILKTISTDKDPQ